MFETRALKHIRRNSSLASFLGSATTLRSSSTQEHIRPADSHGKSIVRMQERQAADHAGARKALWRLLAVKPLDKEDILASDRFDSALRGSDSALASQSQHRVLDPRVVPAIVRPIEFCDPESVMVLDDSRVSEWQ
jgi:hypothetical protein